MTLRNKWIIVGSATTVVFVLGVYGSSTWLGSGTIPAPAEQTGEQIAKYLASDKFGRLPEAQRADYLRKVREAYPEENVMREIFRSNLSDAEREKLRENIGPVFRQQMNQQVDDYFKLPPEQRTKYLDRMIDEAQARRASRGPGRSGPDTRATQGRPQGEQRVDQPGRGGRGFDPGRMRRRIENTDPQTRARREAFFKAMRQRMQERGIEPRGGPGGGR
jgi:hypothetical protein